MVWLRFVFKMHSPFVVCLMFLFKMHGNCTILSLWYTLHSYSGCIGITPSSVYDMTYVHMEDAWKLYHPQFVVFLCGMSYVPIKVTWKMGHPQFIGCLRFLFRIHGNCMILTLCSDFGLYLRCMRIALSSVSSMP